MRIPDAPGVDSTASLQSAASPAKANEHAPTPESAQDEIDMGTVALAASSSLDASDPRIAQLRQQVLDGTYKVDSTRVSSKIIDEHLEK